MRARVCERGVLRSGKEGGGVNHGMATTRGASLFVYDTF